MSAAVTQLQTADSAAPPPAADAPAPAFSLPLSLEERVRRLEDVIAAMHLAPPEWNEATRAARPPLDPALANGIVAAPAALPLETPGPLFPPPATSWLLFEIYAEFRAILRMFFDPRYHLRWFTRLLTLALIAGMVLSRWVIASIPLVGWLLDLMIFVVLLYVLIKVLSREATHYRMTSPDLPPGLRL